MKHRFPFLIVALVVIAFANPVVAANNKAQEWQGLPPTQVRDPKPWMDLVPSLVEKGYYYGAMAAAARMIMLFTDLPSKDLAYRTIVSAIDRGYPFSSLQLFLPGDLEPEAPPSKAAEPGAPPRLRDEYEFYNSYNLYKSLLNQQKGAPKWAADYLSKVDKDGFPKFQFYGAIDLYSKNKLDDAEAALKKLLGREYGSDELPFVRKVARTLARIYFDREQFDKAYDVYSTFLLKLNPVTPSDWLEASWCLYHLKRYQDALGMLYNLESRAASDSVFLEKYTIRALIYRELCDVASFEALSRGFEQEFGPVLQGIKRGEPLTRYPALARLELPANLAFRQISGIVHELETEQGRIKGLGTDQAAVAKYLYDSELAIQRRKLRSLQGRAMDHAADQLIMLSEHLRFLKFDVAREKFNPEAVFRPVTEEKPRSLIEDSGADAFTLRWTQLGDFWRDERLIYVGELPNRCDQ